MRPIFFASPAHFRRWLQANGHESDELLVGFYKKSSGKPSITWPEAVDEALCFGWIDGVRHSLDADDYTVRFTPRKPKSQWSAVNIRRVQELAKSGRMQPPGLQAFKGAEAQERTYSYEQRNESCFTKEQERAFQTNRAAWEFLQSQPPWYRRTATFWVVSAKKEETRQKRLDTLISDSALHRPIKPLTRPVPNRQNEKK